MTRVWNPSMTDELMQRNLPPSGHLISPVTTLKILVAVHSFTGVCYYIIPHPFPPNLVLQSKSQAGIQKGVKTQASLAALVPARRNMPVSPSVISGHCFVEQSLLLFQVGNMIETNAHKITTTTMFMNYKTVLKSTCLQNIVPIEPSQYYLTYHAILDTSIHLDTQPLRGITISQYT